MLLCSLSSFAAEKKAKAAEEAAKAEEEAKEAEAKTAKEAATKEAETKEVNQDMLAEDASDDETVYEGEDNKEQDNVAANVDEAKEVVAAIGRVLSHRRRSRGNLQAQ